MSIADQLELRAWDSAHFGFRIARLHARRLTEPLVGFVQTWCRAQNVRCLYFLADFDDRETLQLAEAHGLALVDGRLTFERPVNGVPAPSVPAGVIVRPAQAGDVAALADLARAGHRDTPVYFDPGFPDPLCDEMYAIWIEKSCHGWAQAVYVATCQDQPAGYITCDLDEHGAGQIGLVGVSARAQGRGIGPALVQTALHWAADRNLQRMTVVTQARNRAAQRMYQRCGFRTDDLRLWYHWWLA